MMSEFEFIKQIRDKVGESVSKNLVLGIGDDAAVISPQTNKEMLFTVDLLMEDIDFKLEYAPPFMLGHKSLAVSLSDIAAMGGTPEYSLLTLAITNKKSEEFWEQFFEGYFNLAGQYGVTLIGGDISSSPTSLTIDSFVIGNCDRGKSIKRSGARAGDNIYVTGKLGASAAGLNLLLNNKRLSDNDPAIQKAITAHLMPQPKVTDGIELGSSGLVTSMIDISDGLLQDLNHICEDSNVSAIIDSDSVPIADEVMLIFNDREKALDFALTGGEDYELLFTSASELNFTRIGQIVEYNGQNRVMISNGNDIMPVTPRGFDHFHS